MNDRLIQQINHLRVSVSDIIVADILLSCLFMRKYELDEENDTDRGLSVSSIAREFGQTISVSDLIEHVSRLEKAYIINNGCIIEGFKETLSKIRDPQEIRAIFELVDRNNVSSDKDLIEIEDILLEYYFSRQGKTGSDICANRSLARLEAEILAAKEGTEVFDGYSGFGTCIVEATNETHLVYVRDKSAIAIARSVINLILHNRNIAGAEIGDSNIFSGKEYDYIISEPPVAMVKDKQYMKRIDPDQEYYCKESVEIESTLRSLKIGGKAVILVNASILTASGRIQRFREELINMRAINAIIGLPKGVIDGTMISSMLLVLEPERREEKILMVDTTQFWKGIRGRKMVIGDDAIEFLKDITYKRRTVEGVSRLVDPAEIISNEVNLAPELYVNPYNMEEIQKAELLPLYKQQDEIKNQLADIEKEIKYLRSE